MNKNESKYFNTAILFDEALIHLLENKDIDYITVKEICNKAGVNRSTFYLHYESINDLLDETMNYINKKFIDFFNVKSRDFIAKIEEIPVEQLNLVSEEYLIPYLKFIKENKKIFKASFNNPRGMSSFDRYNSLKKHIFMPILRRLNINENDGEYLITFHINGIMAVIKEWLNKDCKDSIEYIEDIIMKCVKK